MPTAQPFVRDVIVSPLTMFSIEPGLGLGILFQAWPFQCSSNVRDGLAKASE